MAPITEKIGPKTIIGLVCAILGFATAFLTKIDQVSEFVDKIVPNKREIAGEYTWLFREYRTGNHRLAITAARMDITGSDSNLRAKATTAEGRPRDWKITGVHFRATHPVTQQEGRFINLTYRSTRKERPQSSGSILLCYDSELRAYRGYVMGYDMDIGQITTFPCILTREIDEDARQKYSKILSAEPAIVAEPVVEKRSN